MQIPDNKNLNIEKNPKEMEKAHQEKSSNKLNDSIQKVTDSISDKNRKLSLHSIGIGGSVERKLSFHSIGIGGSVDGRLSFHSIGIGGSVERKQSFHSIGIGGSIEGNKSHEVNFEDKCQQIFPSEFKNIDVGLTTDYNSMKEFFFQDQSMQASPEISKADLISEIDHKFTQVDFEIKSPSKYKDSLNMPLIDQGSQTLNIFMHEKFTQKEQFFSKDI